MVQRKIMRGMRLLSAACLAATLGAGPGLAQQGGTITGTVQPGIWIDPDGCMHWVADGGVEGYMEGRVNPHTGRPVCLTMRACGVAPTDAIFQGDTAQLSAAGRARLQQFFATTGAYAYGVHGHTDTGGASGQRLSAARAAAVADVARSVGALVARQAGHGASQPVAADMSRNRRVEIICYR